MAFPVDIQLDEYIFCQAEEIIETCHPKIEIDDEDSVLDSLLHTFKYPAKRIKEEPKDPEICDIPIELPLDHQYLSCQVVPKEETYSNFSEEILEPLSLRFIGLKSDQPMATEKRVVDLPCYLSHRHTKIFEYFKTPTDGRMRARAMYPYGVLDEMHSQKYPECIP